MKNPDYFEEEQTIENYDLKIIEHNFEEIAKGGVHQLLDESLGGNAGTTELDGKEYHCCAANGYAKADTGEIIMFGNFQDVPIDIRNNNPEFIMKAALLEKYYKIVKFFHSEELSPRGVKNIEEAISKYNLKKEGEK